MRAISIIFKRELGSYLRSPVGWIVAAVLLLIDGVLFQAMAMQKDALSADVLRQFFFLTRTDFAKDHNCFRERIGFEHQGRIGQTDSNHRVTADVHDG